MPDHYLAEWSLLQRYTLQFLIAACVALLIGTLMVLVVDELALREAYDRQLRQFAEAIEAAESAEVDEALGPDELHGSDRQGADRNALVAPVSQGHENHLIQIDASLLYQVWSRDGRMLHQSNQLPVQAPVIAPEQQGYFDVRLRDDPYRVYALISHDGSFTVNVESKIGDRYPIRKVLLVTYLFALCVPVYLVWLFSKALIQRSLITLRRLAADVDKFNPDGSDAVVESPDLPTEMTPLLTSVNQLVHRAAGFALLEQRFASLAAHELRSPLAGIRAQAQLAGEAESPAEVKEALNNVIWGVDRAARVFDQLLAFARMEGMGHGSEQRPSDLFCPVDLQAVCREVIVELEPQLRAKRINLIDKTQNLRFPGVEYAIFLILRNLVSNAMRYTPECGTVEISCEMQGQNLVLAVEDSGPGVPEAERERVFERYVRLQSSNTDGLGLGLAIVRQAVRLHGAQIELMTSALGGLRVRIDFPA